jgi:DNA-binding Lrp family transcriptional regulator
MTTPTDIDDVDRRLLDALLADGRADLSEISDAIGVARTTVVNRLHRLETGVIEGYTATIDYEALGYEVTAVFHLDVAGDGLADVVDRLAADKRLVDVYEVTGSDDVVAIGKFTDVDDMNAQIADLVADERIRNATANVVRTAVSEHDRFVPDAE